jgi:general stress protein 26
MDWPGLVEAAKAINWVTYLGTADGSARPHVSVVAPGFSDGSVWFATRPGSKKLRNIRENPQVGFHWPVGGQGPGELAAWGTATIHPPEERQRIWDSGIFTYDLSQFFGSPDNPDLAFVEADIDRARLLGPKFVADRYP